MHISELAIHIYTLGNGSIYSTDVGSVQHIEAFIVAPLKDICGGIIKSTITMQVDNSGDYLSQE